MVMELLTLCGSRHLAKYCTDSFPYFEHIFLRVQVIDTGHLVTSGGNPQSLILRVLDIYVVGVA